MSGPSGSAESRQVGAVLDVASGGLLADGDQNGTLRAAEWYAVYTRSRHEKMVAEQLADKEIEHLLPVYDVLSQWKDRKKWVQKPLFPGYLFARTILADVMTVVSSRGVVCVVSNRDGPVPVPEGQVEAVRRMVEEPVKVDPWPYLSTGRLVRVKRGPLRGVEGHVVRRNGTCRLVVSIDLLGQAVAAEVAAECLEPA